jgi:probable phosphoglycerate mutase
MRTLRIHLIRHGETAWSLSGQHTGTTDLPLTTLGEEKAKELGARFRDLHFSHAFTSPSLRATKTGELAGLNVIAEITPDLMEWNYGDYEGKTPAEIQTIQHTWDIFQDGAPNGESPQQVQVRVDRLIGRLGQLTGNVAIFTNGHLGRAIGARWIKLTMGQARHLLLSTASHSILSYEHGRMDRPAIEQWNACA